MSASQNIQITLDQWDSCRLSRKDNDPYIGTEWLSVIIQQSFDINSVRKFCVEKDTTSNKVFQAAWGIVLGLYTGNDEICSGFTDDDMHVVIYHSKVDGLRPIFEVLERLEEQNLNNTNNHITAAEALKFLREMAQSSGLFDTCLSIIPRKTSKQDVISNRVEHVSEAQFCTKELFPNDHYSVHWLHWLHMSQFVKMNEASI